MIEKEKKTMEEFMGLYIDFWQFLHLPSELRIKKKEREFMIHTLALNARGVDISSTEYVKEVRRRMGLNKNNEVYNYRSRLKGKGFLTEKNGEILLPQSLNVSEVPRETYFRFKVVCHEPTELKNQRPVREVKKMTDLHRRKRQPVVPKLPDYEPEQQTPQPGPERQVSAAEPVIPSTVPQEQTEVQLPEKPDPEQSPSAIDWLKQSTKLAKGMADEFKNQHSDNSEWPMEAEEAYVDRPDRDRRARRVDRVPLYGSDNGSKLPPIPELDDEHMGGGDTGLDKTRDDERMGRERDGIPTPVGARPVQHVRKSIIDLDED